jgi:hypothetical protein
MLHPLFLTFFYRPFGYSLLFLAGLCGSRASFVCAVALAWSGVLLLFGFNLLPPTSPFSGVCYRAFVSRYSFIVNGWTGELYGLGWV